MRTASPAAVDAALPGAFQNHRWLPTSNKYRAPNVLGNDVKAGNVDDGDATEYLSAAGIIHAMDGWSFLGRAIYSLCRGDVYSTVHLAYYGELRAAVSILANQGIGVLDQFHAVIDDTGQVNKLNNSGVSTHVMAPLAFKSWAGTSSAVEAFKEALNPLGRSLGSWSDALEVGFGTALPALGYVAPAKEWLLAWGIDLNLFVDQKARNAASYRPSAFNEWSVPDADVSVNAVRSVWEPMRPSVGSFDDLDLNLLRLVLWHGLSEKQKRDRLGLAVTEAIQALNIEDTDGAIQRFLTTDPATDELDVLRISGGQGLVGSSQHAVEIIARASLLLRLATGSCASRLSRSSVVKNDLDFWIRSLGTDRGLWPAGEEPDDLRDLWADIEDGLDMANTWLNDTSLTERHTLWERHSAMIGRLAETERAYLWGLGL